MAKLKKGKFYHVLCRPFDRPGKRFAFPTSPHPRRRLRTIVQRSVTLTFHLVQKIGQVIRHELFCKSVHESSFPDLIPGPGRVRGFWGDFFWCLRSRGFGWPACPKCRAGVGENLALLAQRVDRDTSSPSRELQGYRRRRARLRA